MCIAPRERGLLKEWDLSTWFADDTEPQLSKSPPSDYPNNDVSSVFLKSPSSPSSFSSVQSPASRGSKLQQLENYEAVNGRLPTLSPQKPPSPLEHQSPRKRSSSDTNGISTPTSHTKSAVLVVCVCFFCFNSVFAVLAKQF